MALDFVDMTRDTLSLSLPQTSVNLAGGTVALRSKRPFESHAISMISAEVGVVMTANAGTDKAARR